MALPRESNPHAWARFSCYVLQDWHYLRREDELHSIIAAVIIGAAIVIATYIYVYSSPFQTCLRGVGRGSRPVDYCYRMLSTEGV